MPAPDSMRSRPLLPGFSRAATSLAAAVLALGCADDTQAAGAAGSVAPGSAASEAAQGGSPSSALYRKATAPQIALGERADAERVRALAERLGSGLRAPGAREEARRAVLALDPSLGLDYHLLRARWLALEGEFVESAREIEAARERYPDQGRVFATAAELHAMNGRLETAAAELERGLSTVGRTPELDRARGVLALCTARNVPAGWKILTELAALEPDLPFLARPLADAHLLIGRRGLSNGDAGLAAACADDGLALFPDDRDLLELSAEAAAARGAYGAACAIWERFLADGEDCANHLGLLHQRAATAALVLGRRDAAIEHAARAHALGLSATELGFGSTLLREDALDGGIAAYGEGDLARADERFAFALELDPDCLEAHGQRGTTLFRLGRYSEAALHFERSLVGLWERGDRLPSPVHLDLARALVLAERGDEVAPLLERYLEREPSGPFATETREMLDRLLVED